jgi:hypothetical protein
MFANWKEILQTAAVVGKVAGSIIVSGCAAIALIKGAVYLGQKTRVARLEADALDKVAKAA